MESFTDKGAVEENQIWRKVNNQHLPEAHYVSGPSQIPIIILHHRDYYLAQRHVKKLEFSIRFLRTPKLALFLLHSSICAHLLHLAAQAPQATAEEVSSLGVEVECINTMASVVTPPPRASSAKNHLHLSCMQETGGDLIKMKTIKTPRRELHPLKIKIIIMK